MAKVALCTGQQQAFWMHHHSLFSEGAIGSVQWLSDQADANGLDRRQFDSCPASDEPLSVLERDRKDAALVDARGTPFFLLNGQVFRGMQPLEKSDQAISQLLPGYFLDGKIRAAMRTGGTMIHIRRSIAWLLLFPLLIAAAEPQAISPKTITTVLHEGDQVRIGTLAKRVVIGRTISVTTESVGVQTGTQETIVPVKEIDWFRVTVTEGNKRTWLPLILCATVGLASFVAASATEEKQSTYLPIATAVTASLGIGGYYGGRALDRQEIAYRVR